ncbi:ParB/RepB/Spo0J family partition protein [Ruminococcus sp. Marseille-P6503]|uniref:ParB/RepB/Spo0J family partition protein n=1 Tax=Ruminococcus sp. Marseille-P6503 TaxID=2364796 RepID=UPI0013DDFCD7|nr:ParB/RepB/Spo0J family partition protein [Ruminococcus sp. Marseille-P6503]
MKIDFSKESKPRASFSSFETLFENENIKQLPVDLLIPFEDQPFKLYHAEKLAELAADIKENGILSPVIVRPFNTKYQILSGHNRTNAGKLAGLNTIPCIIKDCDERTAKLIMVNSNLIQREELLPSERAYAYKIQKECSSVKSIALKESQDRRQIQRYIRLTYLIKPLLEKVDCGEITFVAGVNLSYLSQLNQQFLTEFIDENEYKVTPKISQILKLKCQDFNLTEDFLFSIFNPNKIEKKKITFKREDFSKYFSDTLEPDKIKESILNILDEYFKNHKNTT